MHLISTTSAIFNQLTDLLNQLKQDDYSASLQLLSDNSIGKHVRHVLEFFDLLIGAATKGEVVNYDKRDHDTFIQSDKTVAEAKIQELLKKITGIGGDKDLLLEASYSSDDTNVLVKTSFNRELAYNIEHAIHHMAIIKIAVGTLFPYVSLSREFGVAYSTVKYQNKQ